MVGGESAMVVCYCFTMLSSNWRLDCECEINGFEHWHYEFSNWYLSQKMDVEQKQKNMLPMGQICTGAKK
jgi:hypothetical protein